MADIDMPETQPAAETQFAETQFETQPTPLGEEDWLQSLQQTVTPNPPSVNSPSPAAGPIQINFTGPNTSGMWTGQLWLSDEEWLELVHWSVGNQHLYCETPCQ
ncbi:hypothetical protein AJ80_10025 [Polytolypa hystricis UAMH7299]|uniref:Uncharacterized protein n=1 Tax=Polytolypa hystricis (strain UAMH7299) TaxID=1447883 RepID=A0A2B7W6E9_POLH7|nr:hypothetical protein AJ80_10025 [Polytolypa hystricis UAMH7299]